MTDPRATVPSTGGRMPRRSAKSMKRDCALTLGWLSMSWMMWIRGSVFLTVRARRARAMGIHDSATRITTIEINQRGMLRPPPLPPGADPSDSRSSSVLIGSKFGIRRLDADQESIVGGAFHQPDWSEADARAAADR